MQINNFKAMYIAELQELFSMEGQLADALQKMAEVASHSSLKRRQSDLAALDFEERLALMIDRETIERENKLE